MMEKRTDRKSSSSQQDGSVRRSLYRRSDEEFISMLRQHEIEQFAEEKRKMVMSRDVNEDDWRQAIRRQVEMDLNNRVSLALAPPIQVTENPTGQRSSRSRRHRQRVDSLAPLCQKCSCTSQSSAETEQHHQQQQQLLQQQHQYLDQQQWNAPSPRRQLRQSLSATNLHSFYMQRPGLLSQLNGTVVQQQQQQVDDDVINSFTDLPDGYRSRSYYQQLVQKVNQLADLSSLTASERHSLNYMFTKQGFHESMLSGALPDGTPVERVNSRGWYRDANIGLLRTQHGPFWPIDGRPMCPTPQLNATCSQQMEPFVITSQVTSNSQTTSSELQQQLPLTTTTQLQQQLLQQQWRGLAVTFDSERTPARNSTTVSQSDGLIFESRFESGNLRQARRVGHSEYELVLQTDLYTKRHTQWFYFRVLNARRGMTYTFTIINLLKPDSLYNHGMQPLLYSVRAGCWSRSGHDIRYQRNYNRLQCPLLARDRIYYELQWQMEFPHDNDTYYIAHCYPYTFSDLCRDLDALQEDKQRSKVMSREVMCQTRAGNSCFLLTITDFDVSANNKQGVVITSRVHPGETNSSWIMKGLLNYLTGSTDTAKQLRKAYIFKVVPMLNPDGVIVGNYRCSLAGRDLNRNYRRPNQQSFPTVWHVKELVRSFSQSTHVLYYCDLHGHSRRQNVFMYGCDGDAKTPTDAADSYLNARILPWLMSQKARDSFSFDDCKYSIRRNKESTSRVVFYRQFNIDNSFTMETSFCGSTMKRDKFRHFNATDLQQIGTQLGEATLEFGQVQRDVAQKQQLMMKISQHMSAQLLNAADEIKHNATVLNRTSLNWQPDDLTLQPDGNSSTAAAWTDVDSRSSATTTTTSAQTIINNCFRLLQSMQCLNLNESDSSDSDSESEPELRVTSNNKRRRRKKRNKKRSSKAADSSPTSESKKREQKTTTTLTVNNGNCGLPAIAGVEASDGQHSPAKQQQSTNFDSMKQFARSFPTFVNKYEGRSNGGIPCYAEERLQERAAKKTRQHIATDVEDKTMLSSLTATSDPTTAFITPSCCVVASSPGGRLNRETARECQQLQVVPVTVATSGAFTRSPTMPHHAVETNLEDSADERFEGQYQQYQHGGRRQDANIPPAIRRTKFNKSASVRQIVITATVTGRRAAVGPIPTARMMVPGRAEPPPLECPSRRRRRRFHPGAPPSPIKDNVV